MESLEPFPLLFSEAVVFFARLGGTVAVVAIKSMSPYLKSTSNQFSDRILWGTRIKVEIQEKHNYEEIK
jgi:hypothetical protein